jgi:hypothetical protein
VPGNVELDLERAGLFPDPYAGTNTWKTRALEGNVWWYHRTFTPPADFVAFRPRYQSTTASKNWGQQSSTFHQNVYEDHAFFESALYDVRTWLPRSTWEVGRHANAFYPAGST